MKLGMVLSVKAMIDKVMHRYEVIRRRVIIVLRHRRAAWPWFDHWARTYDRYSEQRGDQMAAALTFYGFLAFFPLLALAYALLGYVAHFSETFRASLIEAIQESLPGVANYLDVTQIAQARVGAGIFGLLGLMWAGLGAVSSLRISIRRLWDLERNGTGNFALMKLRDLLVLLFLGVMLIGSVTATTITTKLTSDALDSLDLDGSAPGAALLRLGAIIIGMSFNAGIYLVLFTRLSGTQASWRNVFKGALLAAVGFEILKAFAALLVGHTTRNPVYASFAVLAGLLVWLNLVSRLTFYTAAWTATRHKVRTADEPTFADPDAS